MIFIIILFFSILIATLQVVYNVIAPFLNATLILLILIMFIKIRRECKKYGSDNVFKVFYYKKKDIKINDYVILMLNKIAGYHKIIIDDDFITFIHESGVFQFLCINEQGSITGNIDDEKLTHKNKRILNKLKLFKEKENCYIVLDSKCILKIKNNIYQIIYLKNFYYFITQKTKKTIYSKEKIDNLYNHKKMIVK